ncbi:probable mitochondrial import inner membrane translocase subunit TIM21 isoform X2 [Populus nigra]|uniref:probable mitochondrial import inner membrane translocase subunit TIM21 isoform X2 n=1 Tax=Populus nigra TaxID=3691 RepID=UPI002B26490B|nr:probable mitochondrial import inner membrane translocase subunit TIM21 isoform X2 [Populus nigra]
MQHIRRCSGPLRSQKGLSLFLGRKILKGVSDVGLAAFSTSMVAQRGALGNSVTRLPKSDYVRHFSANANHLTKDILRHNGIPAMYGGQPNREYLVSLRSSSQIMETHGESTINICFARSFASKASKKETHKQSETKKDVSTVEDPFDAPTYNIPEKPVTFTEGASYSIIILAGLGVAAAAAYAVFKELIFEPKEYKIFNKALKRIQDDSQVMVRKVEIVLLANVFPIGSLLMKMVWSMSRSISIFVGRMVLGRFLLKCSKTKWTSSGSIHI